MTPPDERPYDQRPAARPIIPSSEPPEAPNAANDSDSDSERRYQEIRAQLNLDKPKTAGPETPGASESEPSSATSAPPARPTTPTKPGPVQPVRKKGGIGCLGVFGIIVGVIVIVIIIAVAAGSKSSGNDSNDPALIQATAQNSCESMVKEQLKSPSTASFSNEDEEGTNPVIVTGDVDSQNAFGATLRSTFHCTGTPDSQGGINTTLDSLDQQ
jgi:hypothetical protein